MYGELRSFYRLPHIVRVIKSRRLRWAGHVPRMEEGRSFFFKIVTDKSTGKRPSRRPRRRREDNIRKYLKEIRSYPILSLFTSFSLPDVLFDPTDLIWRKGTPFKAMNGWRFSGVFLSCKAIPGDLCTAPGSFHYHPCH